MNTEATELVPALRLGLLDDNAANIEGLLYYPMATVIDENNTIYVYDSGNSRVAIFSSTGDFQRSLGRAGEGPGEFGQARNMLNDIDLSGQHLAILEAGTRRVHILKTDGTFLASFTKHTSISSIALLGERVYLSRASRSKSGSGVELHTFSGEMVNVLGQGVVDAPNDRNARRLNRSFIAVSDAGLVGRVFQHHPLLILLGPDGSVVRERWLYPDLPANGAAVAQTTGDPSGSVVTPVSLDIEHVSSLRAWIVLFNGGHVQAFGENLEDFNLNRGYRLMRPVDSDRPGDPAPAFDVGLNPAGDLLCAAVLLEHELWCYEVPGWGNATHE